MRAWKLGKAMRTGLDLLQGRKIDEDVTVTFKDEHGNILIGSLEKLKVSIVRDQIMVEIESDATERHSVNNRIIRIS